EDAVDAGIKTVQSGGPVARNELADAVQLDATNNNSMPTLRVVPPLELNLQVAATLWLEFPRSEASVREQAETVQLIASEHGGPDFSWAIKQEDRRKTWRARH